MIGLSNDPSDIITFCHHCRRHFHAQCQLIRHILRVGKIERCRQLLSKHGRIFKLHQILRRYAISIPAGHQIGVVDILHFIAEEFLGGRYIAVSRHLTCGHKFAQVAQQLQQHLIGHGAAIGGKVIVVPKLAFFLHLIQNGVKKLKFHAEACRIGHIEQLASMLEQFLLRCRDGIDGVDRSCQCRQWQHRNGHDHSQEPGDHSLDDLRCHRKPSFKMVVRPTPRARQLKQFV